MKTKIYSIFFIVLVLLSVSCSDYLEKTPDADVTAKDIFGTFKKFQGFIEPMYEYVEDYNYYLITSMNIGGEVQAKGAATSANTGNRGDYMLWINRSNQQTAFNYEGTSGIWTGSWKGIRIANIALEQLDLLVNATQEEKDLIEGQAYFFRAYFHWEIIRSFGGMPYIDKVFSPDDKLNLPRLTYQQTTEKIVQDLDKAAELLPDDWDNTVVGGVAVGSNFGRATKGAALSFKAKALLYAGSPLMNHYSGNPGYEYHTEYMERAAAAAWEVIKLADAGVYSLTPLSNYRDMFAKNDGTGPYTSENIFQKSKPIQGAYSMTGRHGRLFSPSRFGGNANNECVNQLFVDKFEMADGTPYKLEYDSDNAKRWDFRDPRFRQNIIVDRDKWGFSNSTVFKLYEGGTDGSEAAGFYAPYIIKKFWPIGVNSYDKQWNDYIYGTPQMRLADVYLIYAEAVTVAYGANGNAPGANLSAVDAINKVRLRAEMPAVTAAATGYDSFMDLVRNERDVELCFEGNYWFDIRRWYIAHLPENKDYVDFIIDKDWTSFQRVTLFTRVFDDPRHYWMPLPINQTQLYAEFFQNPGW
jgi:starch-binding outer membrane protein, SusD/RagB family